MNGKIKEIASRIKSLREILGITVNDAALKTGLSTAEYEKCERGEKDFSATFLLKAAQLFNVDVTDLLTGKSPTLTTYTLTRAGDGLEINRRQGFTYKNLAHHFKNRNAEPFFVTAPFDKDNLSAQIQLSSHSGHEFNFILKGSLKFKINDKEETLNAGDSIYYDSSNPHGMVAIGDNDCEFLAVLIK